jgi:MFS family permease
VSPTFRSLAHRDYRRYATGGLVSNVGTWMQRVAQDWLVLVVTGGSASALGITTGLQFLPILLFSAYAGALADRLPKRTMLMITQASMAVPAAALGVLAVTGHVQTWHVYVLAFAFGTATAFDAPVRQSFVSEMVGPDDLANAVSLNSVSFNAGRIIGPAIAGLMIAALGSGQRGTGVVILINAVSYLAVLFALRGIRSGRRDPSRDRSLPRGRIRDGVAYLRTRPDLLLVIGVMGFTGTFGLNFQMTSALMATQVFGKGAGEYGILGTTMAVGSIAGSLLAARRERPTVRLVVVAALVFGTLEIIIGLMPTYGTFMLMTPVIGICAMTTITSANAVTQLTAPAHLRGRVMAIYLMVFMGGTPLGSPLIGWLAEVFGARWSLIGGGIGTIVGSLAVLGLLVARHGKDALYNPDGEPPLPTPGDPGRPGPADRDRPGQLADSWVSPADPVDSGLEWDPTVSPTPSSRPSSTPRDCTAPSRRGGSGGTSHAGAASSSATST